MTEHSGWEIRSPGKLYPRVSGYEDALKRTTRSGPHARFNDDAHLYSINSGFEPDRSTGLSRLDPFVDFDRYDCRNDDYRYVDDYRYDDAHLTSADQLDPTFRSRLSRARKAPKPFSDITDSCRSI